MGQPTLPQWMKIDARCYAKVNGQTYNAIITKELDYGRFKVRTAVPNQLNGGNIFTDYAKPVSHSHLKRRSSYVPGLDTPTPEEAAEFKTVEQKGA